MYVLYLYAIFQCPNVKLMIMQFAYRNRVNRVMHKCVYTHTIRVCVIYVLHCTCTYIKC